MAKTTKVFDLCDGGRHFTVIRYNDGRVNPYYLYWHSFTFVDGYPKEHKSLIAKYADLKSAVYAVAMNM